MNNMKVQYKIFNYRYNL